MSNINKLAPLSALLIFIFAPIWVNAQTIAQIASLQRAKQIAEIEKSEKESAAATVPVTLGPVPLVPGLAASAAGPQGSPRTKAKARSNIFVHAVYAKQGMWIAEISQGQILSVVLPGMVINGYRAASVTQQGIELTKPCTKATAEPTSGEGCGRRLVRLGEAI